MGAPTFLSILTALRDQPRRARSLRYVFSDEEMQRIAGLAEAARGDDRSQEAAERALDVLERELEPFIVRPA